MTRRVGLTILGVLLIVGTTTLAKARAVPTMITHVDDIGVAVTLLEAQNAAGPDAVAAALARHNGHGPLALLIRTATAVGATTRRRTGDMVPILPAIRARSVSPRIWCAAPPSGTGLRSLSFRLASGRSSRRWCA